MLIYQCWEVFLLFGEIFGRGLIPLGATIGGGISTYFSVGIAILISVIIVLLGLCIVLFSDELKKYT